MVIGDDVQGVTLGDEASRTLVEQAARASDRRQPARL